MIKIKRVYEAPDRADGVRVLVDRLWPRGLSKEKARIDLWVKEIAPSCALRKWFSHDFTKWNEFKAKYQAELSDKKGLLRQVNDRAAGKRTVTLLFAAKDEKHNNAVALLETIQFQRKPRRTLK